MVVGFVFASLLSYSQQVDQIDRLDANPTNATTVQFRVEFSGGNPPYGPITTDDFTLTSTVGGNIVSVSSGSANPTVDVTVNGIAGDGTIRLDLNDTDNSILDMDSDPLVSNTFTSGESYTIDNTAPSFASVSDGGDGSYRAGESIILDVDLGETGLTVTADLSVLDSDFSNTQALNDDGDGTYSFTTAALDGGGNMQEGTAIAVNFSAQDAAGNSTGDNSLTLLLDKTDPSFTSVSDGGDGSYRAGESISLDVDLGETGLSVTADLSVLDSDFSNTQALNDDGDGTYSFTTAALDGGGNMQEGTAIAVNFSAQDAAGNSTGDNSLTLLLDKQIPTLNSPVNLAPDNTYIDINFSEGVYRNWGGTNPLITNRLELIFSKNSGIASDVTILSVKQTDSPIEGSASDLVGGETDIRVFLNVAGVPDGNESVEITPQAASSIFDRAGNQVSTLDTAGAIFLYNQCTVVADAGNDTTICNGESVNIGGISTGNGGSGFYNYEWRIPADGPAIISTARNPSEAPTTTTIYEVTVIDSYGCRDTDQVTINIYASPAVSFDPDSVIFRNDGSPFRLDDNGQLSPLHTAGMGGTLSGSGITYNSTLDQYYFDPTLAADGDNSIIYTYRDVNGCEAADTQTLKVISPSGAVLNLLTEYCSDFNGGVVNGLQAAPGSVSPGRTFESLRLYKNGVGYIVGPLTDDNTDNIYDLDLDALGGGDFSIAVFSTFNSGTPAGAHLDNYSTSLLFAKGPAPTISSLEASYCSDASPFILIGSIPSYTNPMFSASEGVSGNQFDPGSISFGPGQYQKTITITYDYDDDNGCAGSITQDVTVYRVPTAPTVAALTEYCTEDNIHSLTVTGVSGALFNWYKDADISNPANFLDNGATFDPVDAGGMPVDNSMAGTYQYWVTQTLNGCESPATQTTLEIYQRSAPQITGLNPEYCVDTGPIIFSVGDANGLPVGSETIKINGAATATPEFDPSALGIGRHSIQYIYVNNNGCADSTEVEVVVNPLQAVDFSGFNASRIYCYSDNPVTLVGSPAVTPGTTGTFSINTGGLLNNGGTGIVTFSPSLAAIAAGADSLGPVTTHDITYTFTDAKGCTNFKTYTITVYPLPATNFSGLNADKAYCFDAESIILTGNPKNNNGFFSGNGIADQGDGTATFTPDIAAALAGASSPTDQLTKHAITYTYTSVLGCINKITDSVTVNPLPEVSFSGYNAIKTYCYDDTAVVLTGTPLGSTGIFTGSGIINNGDGTALFTPQLAAADSGAVNPTDFATDHWLTYTYTDANGCVNDQSYILAVDPLPELNFTNLEEAYCLDHKAFILKAIPAGGTFSGPGVTGNTFDPSVAGVGIHTLTYTYTSNKTSCTNFVAQDVIVRPLPIPDFTFTASCNDATVSFTDVSNIAAIDTLDQITEYAWNFGDFSAMDTIPHPSHTYNKSGTYTITSDPVTAFGCTNSKDTTLFIDAIPNADFTWLKACLGDTTQFTSTSTVSLGSIGSYAWDFGDGTILNGGEHVAHEYQETGIYQAKLSITTSNGCIDTITKEIYVLPKITTFPYVEDFETAAHGWMVEGTNPSWEQGKPAGIIINGAASGEQVLMTRLDGVYNPNEASWVNSPCIDISSLENPVLSLKTWYVTDVDFDGTVIQTSIDDGQSWQVLGSLEEGIAWYNSASIVGHPGQQETTAMGWTGTSTGWQNAKFSLDQFTGVPCVRFRVAFGSNADNTPGKIFDGFAFDDFRIRERNRKILLEHFTNVSSSEFARVDAELQQFAGGHSDEIITLQYHTGFPGSDPLNKDNRSDPSARALYYGIAQAPRVIMDGIYKDEEFSQWAEIDFQERILDDAPFILDVSFENEIENRLNVKTEVRALTAIEVEATLHIAIVEREIETELAGLGKRKYYNVLKKMLPHAGGIQLEKTTWTTGEIEEVNQSWSPKNIFDAEQLAVVVFLQDNTTKEIYQATIAQPEETPQVITGVNDWPETQGGGDFILYPNPASDQVQVLLEKSSIYQWKVYDKFGRVVMTGKTNYTPTFTFDVHTLPSGLYILQLENKDKENFSARFSVTR